VTTRCVLVDFGNVIAFFDHRKACRQLAALSSVQMEVDAVYAEIFQTQLEADYDTGRISTRQFLDALRGTLRLDVTDDEIGRAWSDIYTPNEAMATTLQALKARGLRLVLASNTNELHHDWFDRVFADTLSVFDARVLSYQVGSRKPDRHFFAACLTAAECPASSCLYVDDRADFVAAGRVLGLTGLVYAPGVDVQAATCY
jgi:HAD superfamily hydrolase (TIGR01509 family)